MVMQDGAPAHRAKETLGWLAKSGMIIVAMSLNGALNSRDSGCQTPSI